MRKPRNGELYLFIGDSRPNMPSNCIVKIKGPVNKHRDSYSVYSYIDAKGKPQGYFSVDVKDLVALEIGMCFEAASPKIVLRRSSMVVELD